MTTWHDNIAVKMSQAKRVILRLDQSEFDDSDPHQIARLYFTECGRSFEEFKEGHHFIHIQLPNYDIKQSKAHVIIDMEVAQFFGPLPANFPHEIYRVRRIDGEM